MDLTSRIDTVIEVDIQGSIVTGRFQENNGEWPQWDTTHSFLFQPARIQRKDAPQDISIMALVFYDSHEDLLTDQRAFEHWNKSISQTIVPYCYGLVVCQVPEKGTGEVWKQSALAFKIPDGFCETVSACLKDEFAPPVACFNAAFKAFYEELAEHHICVRNTSASNFLYRWGHNRVTTWNLQIGCEFPLDCNCKGVNTADLKRTLKSLARHDKDPE